MVLYDSIVIDSQEVRAVERGILLETLANQLPPDTIRFSAKLAKIDKTESGETLLKLTDGTRLSAKVANLSSTCAFRIRMSSSIRIFSS